MAKTQFQSLQIQARAEQHQSYFCQNYFLGSIILVPLLPRYQTNNHYIEEEGRKEVIFDGGASLSLCFLFLSLPLVVIRICDELGQSLPIWSFLVPIMRRIGWWCIR